MNISSALIIFCIHIRVFISGVYLYLYLCILVCTTYKVVFLPACVLVLAELSSWQCCTYMCMHMYLYLPCRWESYTCHLWKIFKLKPICLFHFILDGWQSTVTLSISLPALCIVQIKTPNQQNKSAQCLCKTFLPMFSFYLFIFFFWEKI